MKNVPEMLRQCAETFEERHKQYGDNYKQFGSIMVELFANQHEFDLTSKDDWNRMGLLVQMVSKLTRYVSNWDRGGHDDSLLDLSVYAQMLREIDTFAHGLTTDEVIENFFDELAEVTAERKKPFMKEAVK